MMTEFHFCLNCFFKDGERIYQLLNMYRRRAFNKAGELTKRIYSMKYKENKVFTVYYIS